MITLTRYEQETIFNYNQEERFATCFTHDKALIRRMDKLTENDTEVIVVREGEGWKEYKLPKKYIKVRQPRKLSDEQRKNMADRMRSLARKEDE